MDDPTAKVVNLISIAATAAAARPAWSYPGADLNVNLVVLNPGDGIEEHVNREVEVLLVGVTGTGTVTVDGQPLPLVPGSAVVVPKGARRGTSAGESRFAYLTCHRRRAGLWPTTAR